MTRPVLDAAFPNYPTGSQRSASQAAIYSETPPHNYGVFLLSEEEDQGACSARNFVGYPFNIIQPVYNHRAGWPFFPRHTTINSVTAPAESLCILHQKTSDLRIRRRDRRVLGVLHREPRSSCGRTTRFEHRIEFELVVEPPAMDTACYLHHLLPTFTRSAFIGAAQTLGPQCSRF